MVFLRRMRCLLIVAICVSLVFCFSFSAQASQEVNVIQPEILQILLSMAGLEAQVLDLNREDGFEKGVCIEGVQDFRLLIGFPKTGIEKETPFLLSFEGAEVLVEVSEERGLIVIEGDDDLIPLGVVDFVECITSSVADLVQDISECGANPFCIVVAVISGVFRILGCIFYFL